LVPPASGARATEFEKTVDDRRLVWPPAGSVSLPLEAPERVGPKSLIEQPLSGDIMLNMTRLATLAAVLLLATPAAIVAPAALAQTPAPAAAPAAPPAPAAAPAPVAAAAPAATAKAAPEVVDNPYGLEALWKGGDWVAKTTLAILVIMSMGSWYIIITKVYEQSRMSRQAKLAEKKFWSAPSVREGAESLKTGSPFRLSPNRGLKPRRSTTACWAR
jgi:hypothetical protein